jgi:hypothetical protein
MKIRLNNLEMGPVLARKRRPFGGGCGIIDRLTVQPDWSFGKNLPNACLMPAN